MIELVGQGHQKIPANPRLNILFGDIFLTAAKHGLEGFEIAVEKIRNGQHLKATAASPGERFGVLQRLLRTVGGRQGNTEYILWSQSPRRQGSGQGRVDAAGKPEN